MSDLVSGVLSQIPRRPNFACHDHDDQCLLVGRKLFLTGLRQFLQESALDGKSPKKHCQSKRTLSSYSVKYLINLLVHFYPTGIWKILKRLSFSGSVHNARYIPRRIDSMNISSTIQFTFLSGSRIVHSQDRRQNSPRSMY